MAGTINPISSRSTDHHSSFIVKKNNQTGDLLIEKITGNILERFAQILKKLLFESTGFSFYIRDKSITKITIGFLKDATKPDHINKKTMSETSRKISVLKDQKLPSRLEKEIDSFETVKKNFEELERKALEFVKTKYDKSSSKEYQENFIKLYFELSEKDYAKPIRDFVIDDVLSRLNPKDDFKTLLSLIQDNSYIDYPDKLKILRHVSENLNPDRYEDFVTALAFFNADRLEAEDRINFIKPFLSKEMDNLKRNGTKIDGKIKELKKSGETLTSEIDQLKEEMKTLLLTYPKREDLKIFNKFSLPSGENEYKNVIGALRDAVRNDKRGKGVAIPREFEEGLKSAITNYEVKLQSLTQEREERRKALEKRNEKSNLPDFFAMELSENEIMLKEFGKKYDLPEIPTREDIANKIKSLSTNSPLLIPLKAEARAILDLSNAVKEKRLKKALASLKEISAAVVQLKAYNENRQALGNRMTQLREKTDEQQKAYDTAAIFENALADIQKRLNKLIDLSNTEAPGIEDYKRALNPGF